MKTKRLFSLSQKTALDIKTSENQIGMFVNLSQELNTLLFHNLNHHAKAKDIHMIYLDICKLAVMSGLEIDSAKKEFSISSSNEYKELKRKWKREHNGKVIKPYFFKKIAQIKGYEQDTKKEYVFHDSTMDYLQKIINMYLVQKRKPSPSKNDYLPFDQILNQEGYNVHHITREQVAKIIQLFKDYSAFKKRLFSMSALEENKNDFLQIEKEKLYRSIGKTKLSRNTIIYLLKTFDHDQYKPFYLSALYILFGYPNSSFYQVIKESQEKLPVLKEDACGKLQILNKKYKKIE
ncbi:MAG: hypothetical protein ACLRVU_03325 [Beduini sp.]|uniref:hypothetical protein n=1 Tax=Beduini sp. TaxID=1922300 RepID=UPI0039A1C07C